MAPAILQRGEELGSRYVVQRKIGEGQFAEVYEVEDSRTTVALALKVERKPDVRTVKQECKVLRRLQGCRHICKLHDSGTHNDLHFMVMDLLGANLVETRRGELGGRAELATAKLVAAGLLGALEGLHRAGYIHRDVKPANFAVFPPAAAPAEGEWVLIDFGLARRYVDDEGKALAERQDASFRGSTTYASMHAHDDKDLSRRDDLWSWFYVLVELLEGTLPWRADREAAAADGTASARDAKDSAAQRKAECMQHPEQLFSTMPCPQAVLDINKYLSSLGFRDEPNYGLLSGLLNKLDATPSATLLSWNGGMAATQLPLPAPSAAGPTRLDPECHPPQQPVEPAPVQRSKQKQHRDRAVAEVSTDLPAEKHPVAKYGSGIAAETGVRDLGSRRDRGGGRNERDRERETTRRRSRSRGRRSRSRGERSRSPRERRRSRSRSRGRRVTSRSRSRQRQRRSRTRSPDFARKVEQEQRGSERDAAADKRLKGVRHLVGILRQGRISEEGSRAAQQLTSLQPSEAIGIACWYLEELSAGVDPKHAAALSELLEDAATFVAGAAKECAGR